MSVRKKYDDKKFSRISKLPDLYGDIVKGLAAGDF